MRSAENPNPIAELPPLQWAEFTQAVRRNRPLIDKGGIRAIRIIDLYR